MTESTKWMKISLECKDKKRRQSTETWRIPCIPSNDKNKLRIDRRKYEEVERTEVAGDPLQRRLRGKV